MAKPDEIERMFRLIGECVDGLGETEEEAQARMVAQDNVGDLFVSTVAINSQWGKAPFETMVFPTGDLSEIDKWTRFYQTRDEALKGHFEILKQLTEGDHNC